MNRRTWLHTLEKTTIRSLNRLRVRLNSINKGWSTADQDLYISHVTINLLNIWSNFVRAYYLSCSFSAKSSNGVKVFPSVKFARSSDAIGRAIVKYRPAATPNSLGIWHRRDEPTWHDPAVLLTLATDVGLSNINQIVAALSLGSRVFNDLPTARNYFGHRNEGTFQAALGISTYYGIPKRGQRPATLLHTRPLGRPQPLLLEWIDDIQATVELLCD